MRSSDRRKLADQIIANLGLSLPPIAEDATPEQKAAATSSLTTLRQNILPENAQSARFSTTRGPELKQVNGTAYFGKHDGSEQRVLWVKVDDLIWPTVYSLWHNPRIVSLLHTHEPVIGKLQGGADLMVPGLAGGPPFPAGAKKGAVVAIASADRPSVPVVVGVCSLDVCALGSVQGEKGIAVEVLGWVGDEISGNEAGKLGVKVPDAIDAWLADDEESVGEAAEAIGGVSLEDTPAEPMAESRNVEKEISEDEYKKDWSTAEIDEVFYQALLYGLYESKKDGSPPRYGLDLPLKPSFIMSNLIQPFLPIFTASDADALQMKKTSWKTMKKFLKFLDKKKPPFCWTKDQGGETNIFMLDFDHPEVDNFRKYSLPRKAKEASSTPASTSNAPSGTDPSIGQKLRIQAFYKVREKHASLFITSDSHGYHTAGDIKNIVSEYIEKEDLVSANKRLVKLNPFIANSIIDGTKATDRDVIMRGTILRDVLTDRVLSMCSAYHVIHRNTVDPNAKPKAGAAPRVTIVLETRSGNKTVTKVSGLEAFFIAPQPLADELRKTCAGSTSVDQTAGSSSKNPVMEVMVQGPQSQVVLAALEKRGVDKRWIDVVDKVKKKK